MSWHKDSLLLSRLRDVPCAPTNDACGDKGRLAHMREAVMVVMGEVEMPCKYQNTQKRQLATVAWLPCALLFCRVQQSRDAIGWDQQQQACSREDCFISTSGKVPAGAGRSTASAHAQPASDRVADTTNTGQKGWQAAAVEEACACLPENQSLMFGCWRTSWMKTPGSLLWLSQAQRFLTCTVCSGQQAMRQGQAACGLGTLP